MRVVPVIDLKDSRAVHAVRGDRESYRPLPGDPLSIARAFRSELGLDELYVADLDAIGGGGDNNAIIGALARDARVIGNAGVAAERERAPAREARVMVDAGIREPGRARALLDLGAHRVVVGTETLPGLDALDRLLADVPDVVVSVDLRDGRLLSPHPRLAGLPALDAMARLQRAGVREAIVLDLARVGSGAGPDLETIAAIHAAFPDLELLAGGGVRDVADLRALAGAGAAGALVATALHRGVIGARELR
jgi:phosphoribosylformimino-5-aminoimidazole carboxamide ribotide isomerase